MSSHIAASLYFSGMLGAGIAMGNVFQPDLARSGVLVASFLFLTAIAIRGPFRKLYWPLAGLAFMGLGLFCMANELPENQPRHYRNHLLPNTGSVEIEVLESLKPGQSSWRYTGEVRFADHHRTTGKVLLEIRKDSALPPLTSGQRIRTPLLPTALKAPLNPGGFDYSAYLESQGIHGRLKLSKGTFFLSSPSRAEGRTTLKAHRERLLSALEQMGLGRDQTPIAKALLLGDRTGVDALLSEAYKKAGVLHLLAISGLHVGILATFLFSLLAPLKWIPFGRQIRLILGLSALWGYALIAGFSPSVVRAVMLCSFMAFALFLGRPGQTLHFLGLSWMFMLVAINPLWLFQIGFQLSFAAVGAIVVFYPFIFGYWPLKRGPGRYFGKLIAVSLAAQIGTLPLTLYYFHQFPGLFLLSNLVLLPGIGLLLVTGLLCLGLEVFFQLPPVLARLLDILLGGMNAYVQWAAGQEAFFFEGISVTGAQCVLAALSVVLFGIYLRLRQKRVLYGMALLLLGLQVTGITDEVKKQRSRRWVIPQQVAHSMVWLQEGPLLKVFASDSVSADYLVRDALRHWGLKGAEYLPPENRYDLEGEDLRVLDSSGLYSPLEKPPDILLLSGSPKIHMGRLLHTLKPAIVIADGSNYTSDLKRWERSCRVRGIPFHATSRDGAFILESSVRYP